MKTLKALLVDDERNALIGLEQLLKLYCSEVEVCGCASTVTEARDMIIAEEPHIVFLDVQLPEGSGFDLVDIARSLNCAVIFVTGYADYAPLAFRVAATDYLLKPIAYRELREAVGRVVHHRDNPAINGLTTDYRIRICTTNGIRFASCKEVVSIEGDGRYSIIHFLSGPKQIVSKNIGEFEEELIVHGFFRVHKSWLINCDHVLRLAHVDGGTLELSDGNKVLLSRRRKVEFLKRMQG